MNELHKAYAVLGLDAGSSMESILRRYKRLIMVWHPDRAPTKEHKEFAEEELKKINNAKDVLTKHFGATGGHKATGCDCQASETTSAGAGAKSTSAGGASPGPGPAYHRTKTPDEKYQEEQAAKKRDAERKAREEAEANAKKAQASQQYQSAQPSMETAMQQQKALQDEKLRWQASIGIVIAFIALEIFGSMAIGAKSWWHDFSWKWQSDHSQPQKPIGTTPDTTPSPYIEPYNRTPGGNQTTWQQEQAQRDKEKIERDQKQHDQDIYFTRLDVDKYQKIIEHCNSELTNLAMKIADPAVSEYEKNRLRETRDFRQKNLEEAQTNLKFAQEKLAGLTGEPVPVSTPSVVSPFTTRPSTSLFPTSPSNGISPFAPPAAPNSSSLTPSTTLTPSTSDSLFKHKYGLDSLSKPSSTGTLSPFASPAAPSSSPLITPAPSLTDSLFKQRSSVDSLTKPPSSIRSFSDILKNSGSTSQPSTTTGSK